MASLAPPAAEATLTRGVHDAGVSVDEYVRCLFCGQRAPTEELLERHWLRACLGWIPAWQEQEAA